MKSRKLNNLYIPKTVVFLFVFFIRVSLSFSLSLWVRDERNKNKNKKETLLWSIRSNIKPTQVFKKEYLEELLQTYKIYNKLPI